MTRIDIFKSAIVNTGKLIKSIQFLLIARLKHTHFTRKSKISFVELILFMLNFTKKTLQIELDDFVKEVKCSDMIFTKQAFSKARQKINPMAFKYLFEDNVKLFLTATDLKSFKSYRLLAIDGSTSQMPKNTPELRDYFGFAQGGKEDVAMAKLSGLYDIENEVMLDVIIDHYKTDERSLAVRHIEKLKEYGLKNDLVLFDRGYPSKYMIAYMYESNINFVMRVSSSFTNEVNNVRGNDEVVEFKYSSKSYKIRVIKVILKTGETEILITSIMDKSFTIEDFKELYFKRWGMEVKYNEIKNRLQIENYTGETPIAIEQDFYASMYLSNMVGFAKMSSDEEIEENNRGKNLKYEYKTNANILIGKLKNKLILMIMEPNENKRLKILKGIMKEISRNVIPIRSDRENPRHKKVTRNKYPMNRKNSLQLYTILG